MTCDDIRELLDAWHDGELVAETRATVAEHLNGCPECARAVKSLDELRAAIRSAGSFTAPPALRARIANALASGASNRATVPRWRTMSALAASHVGAILLAGSATYFILSGHNQREFALKETVAAHVRGLLDERAIAVASDDQHTVRPWFAGKLDFSPAVANLAAEGFPLLGARIDYVAGRYVAALVYGRRQHKITVFVAKADGALPAAASPTARSGYNVRGWLSRDLAYRAVSDLNDQELGHFAELMRQKTES